MYHLKCHLTPVNKYRKDIKDVNTKGAWKNVNNNKHTFSRHKQFIIFELTMKCKTTPTETMKHRLRKREKFWLKKLKTLAQYGLNQ